MGLSSTLNFVTLFDLSYKLLPLRGGCVFVFYDPKSNAVWSFQLLSRLPMAVNGEQQTKSNLTNVVN